MKNLKTINQKTLREKLDAKDDFILLETTPADEFQKGHLPGAKNLPFVSIESRASDLIPEKNSRIVVYGTGSDDDSSAKASTKLMSMGYTRLYHFAGGKAAWNAETAPAAAV